MRKSILHILIMLFLFISCTSDSANMKTRGDHHACITIELPTGYHKYREQLQNKCRQAFYHTLQQSNTCLKIIIYSYSSGIERYRIHADTSSQVVTNKHEKGFLAAMVIVKQHNSCKDVFFIKVKGNGMDDMAAGMCSKIQDNLE